MSRYYGTCRYTQTRYRTSPYRLRSHPTGGYVTTTPSHHSVVHQNCLLNGQVIGISRGFHGRKFTKRRGTIVTHLTLGLRGRLLQCKRETFFGFYIIKTLFLQCKTPNRISKPGTQLGSSQVAHARGRRLGLEKPSPPPCLVRKFCKGTDKRMVRSLENRGTDKDRLHVVFSWPEPIEPAIWNC